MAEAAWKRRFRAAQVTLPAWARDEPGRLLYGSNQSGTWELYAWDQGADAHRQVTERPEGTTRGRLDPAGERIWWFDDTGGDERGVWVVEAFDGGEARPAAPELPAAYGAGIALARDFAVIGRSSEAGSEIHLVRPGEASRLLYAHPQTASVEGLSRDERLVAIEHAEYGDSIHPAVRVLDLEGRQVAELWDGPGLGLAVAGWSPVAGDNRLLVMHEREDARRPLLWSPEAGATDLLAVDLPGELSASWYPDASALLFVHEHRGRGELYRYDLAERTLTPIESEPGTITGAGVRPDGEIWYSWTRSSTAPEIRTVRPGVAMRGTGDDGVVLRPAGEPAPGGVAYVEYDVAGVHGFVAEPPRPRPHPTVFWVHGGPTAHDRDAYSPRVQAWVDHGWAVVLVNYRGSSGYGRAWRDAIQGNPGRAEMSDIVAVQEWAVGEGIADPRRIVLAGGSWGGYLTLWGLGTEPERWALGIAAVPVADFPAAYADEMEPLKAYDRSLFGGSPAELPALYEGRSPLTYIDRVRVPVLITAGANDPRCPIRQIEKYVARLEALEKPHEVYRYDAGHGSLVTDETIRQTELMLDFARRHLGHG